MIDQDQTRTVLLMLPAVFLPLLGGGLMAFANFPGHALVGAAAMFLGLVAVSILGAQIRRRS